LPFLAYDARPWDRVNRVEPGNGNGANLTCRDRLYRMRQRDATKAILPLLSRPVWVSTGFDPPEKFTVSDLRLASSKSNVA
jgi:hypothetical protein